VETFSTCCCKHQLWRWQHYGSDVSAGHGSPKGRHIVRITIPFQAYGGWGKDGVVFIRCGSVARLGITLVSRVIGFMCDRIWHISRNAGGLSGRLDVVALDMQPGRWWRYRAFSCCCCWGSWPVTSCPHKPTFSRSLNRVISTDLLRSPCV